MSGLFGEAELFASLADEWQKNLDGPYPPGRIAYFKMDEACSLNGEFHYWSPENRDRIEARLDLIAHEKSAPFWQHLVVSARLHPLNQPYLSLCQQIFIAAVNAAIAKKATAPIDIILDEHDPFHDSVKREFGILADWEKNPQRRALLPHQPIFRDDKDFVVLQAADMLAGDLRLKAENYPNKPSFVGKLCPHLKTSTYDIGEKTMRTIHERLSAEYGSPQNEQ
jgi:hypothetical protein